MTNVSHYLLSVSRDEQTGEPRFSVRDTVTGALRQFLSSVELAQYIDRIAEQSESTSTKEGRKT